MGGRRPSDDELRQRVAELESRNAALERQVARLISDRRELIGNPEFRAQGWEIGSGPTEAQCKTAASRLKGRGRRWNPANAIAISTIEAVHQSRLHTMFWSLNGHPICQRQKKRTTRR